jgi:pimeloyl-ACP methyl ester carboxylesterase
MEIIMVPGFWLDASAWDDVVPPLRAAGHTVHPLTLPGKESGEADRAGIGLREHVEAVVREIDALEGPVVLVGHSGGGAIIHAAVDARPDRVARAVYVDSGPLGEGLAINPELPADGDDVPLPAWDVFQEQDLIDLTAELRERFRATAVPEPRRVASDEQHLTDHRRFSVPVTVITCQFSPEELQGWVDAGVPQMAELGRVADHEIVHLPTGHWPMLTRPRELGETILAAVDR